MNRAMNKVNFELVLTSFLVKMETIGLEQLP